MAVRTSFTSGEVLTAADLTDTFAAKADKAAGYQFAETVYFTSNGTFTKATYPWLRAIRVKVQGAGGGGAGVGATGAGVVAVGQNGAGGAYAESFITDIAGLSASVTVTIGAGGAGGAAGGNDGAAGGNASFGALVSANGGSGGQQFGGITPYQTLAPMGRQPTATGDFTVAGRISEGTHLINVGRVLTAAGGGSFLGDGATPLNTTTGANGTNGIRGGGGVSAVNCENQATTRTGGSGGDGMVIVELYA
jgi:hypothetical protein